jgi:heme/copper-type cytochrome/quinol oxidase subunit 4
MFNLSSNSLWLLLLAVTGVTYWLGESGQMANASLMPVLGIFGIAFVKAWVVIQDFMELRHAPKLWRNLLLAWLLVVISMIVLAYWLGLRQAS